MQIIDGKKIKNDILAKVKKEVEALPFFPVFCDVLVGNDPASLQYVHMKARNAEAVGVKFHSATFPETITTADLIKEIKILNETPNMCGIIVQLPLPPHLNKQQILDSINPELDVDCLGSVNNEKFYQSYDSEKDLGLPTALSCVRILDSINLDSNPSTSLRTRKIVVLGQGNLVGKPTSALLRFRGLKPNMIGKETENKEQFIKEADVIISGMGRGKYITGDMIKKGAVLIDAGTSEDEGAIVGDVDLDSVKDVAGYVSPVPGGVGPVTVAVLINNVLTVAKNKNIHE
jgi:methylenetetrahydrofolate dehydrogenase (NADP+)/methenyltetrahydrofolate cyclohydrolase